VKEWDKEGKVRWSRRAFQKSDFEGRFLVVAATSSSELNKKIFRMARQRGVLCNVVDVPDLCDFYYPAVVQRGALQIAVSTSGESPALAQRLRKKLEEEFEPEYEAWLQELGRSRRKLNSSSVDTSGRKAILHSMASEESFRAFLQKCAATVGKKRQK
jgi:siroheme synthase-like protein